MHINIYSQQLCETQNYYQPYCTVGESKLNSLSSFWQKFFASTGNQFYAESHPRTLNRSGNRYDVTPATLGTPRDPARLPGQSE